MKSGKRKRIPTSTSSKALTFSTCEVQFKRQITKISRIGDTHTKINAKLAKSKLGFQGNHRFIRVDI